MAVTPQERAKYAKRRYGIARTWLGQRAIEMQKRNRATAKKKEAASKTRHSAAASQSRLKLSTRKPSRKSTESKSQRVARFKRVARKNRRK